MGAVKSPVKKGRIQTFGLEASFFLREAMSHAWTECHTDIGSLLPNDRMTDWTHTANAATVSTRRVRN